MNVNTLSMTMMVMLYRYASSMVLSDGSGDGVYSQKNQNQMTTFIEEKPTETSIDNQDWYFEKKDDRSLTKQSQKINNQESAGRQFMFWKTITKLLIPQVKFIQKATESTLMEFCQAKEEGLHGKDCFKFGDYLLRKWPSEDFMRTPSKEVKRIKKHHQFQKALVENLILVLRNHRDNLTQILEMEKKAYCDRKGQENCDVDCLSPQHSDMHNIRVYCDISEVILLHLDKVLATLEKEGRRYFKLKLKKAGVVTPGSTKKMYTLNSDFYQLAVLYNLMQQNYETEAALEYLGDLSTIQRL